MKYALSRAGLLRALAVALVAAGFAGQIRAQVPDVLIMWPDIIYVNGVIVTMDDTEINDNPGAIVQAMAVRDEKIVALGTNDEIRKMKGPQTKVVDLQGHQVLPGLVDSHKHIMWGAEERATNIFSLKQTVIGYRIEIPVERTPKETLAKIESVVKQLRAKVDVGEDEWIDVSLLTDTEKGYPSISVVSNMMDTREPEKSAITQEDIDRIVSDRMFQVDSAGGIFNDTGDSEPGIWVHITAGPDGAAVFEEVLKVEDWVEWDYASGRQ
jgi:hypothetical protein